MNEQQLYAMFLQWLPTAIPELKGATPKQVEGVVQRLAQTEEGKQKLEQLKQIMLKQLSTQAYQRGGTFNRAEARWNKHRDVSAEKFASEGDSVLGSLRNYGKQGRLVAKGMATEGFNATDFDPTREFDRKDFRARKQEARDMGYTNRRQIKAYAVSEKGRMPLESKNIDSSNELNTQNVAGHEGTSEPVKAAPLKDFTPVTKSTEVKATIEKAPVTNPIKTQAPIDKTPVAEAPVAEPIAEKVPNALAYKQAVTTNVKSTVPVKPAVTKPAPARAPLAAAANTSVPYSSMSGYVTPTTQKPPLARAQATSTPTKSNSVWSKIGNFLGKLKDTVLR